MNRRYDHIIVGAGSAGAVLAARLTEDRHRSALLVEAGPDYPAPESMPDSAKYAYGTGTALKDSGLTWDFRARATDEAYIDVPRGKVDRRLQRRQRRPVSAGNAGGLRPVGGVGKPGMGV